MISEKIKNIITTLLINGFQINKIDRPAENHIVFHIYRYDKLGAKVDYSILFSEENKETPILNSIILEAQRSNHFPMLVSDNYTSSELKCYSENEFFNIFGGITNTGLILIPKIDIILDNLGFNKLPAELQGNPEDLHEIYANESLQFLIQRPTRRFGADRLFESLPDGIIIGNGFIVITDTKSYSQGFSFSSDDVKRFASYVQEFNSRYSDFLGKVLSVVVISGKFTDSSVSIESRSNELYRICGSKLVIMKSIALGEMVKHFSENPDQRRCIDWSKIFVQPAVTLKEVQKEISRIQRDNLI